VKKVHAVAVHFSYSTRFDKMMQRAKSTLEAGSYPKTRPKVDKNTTRVMDVHKLCYSTCRSVKALQIYATSRSSEKTTKEANLFVPLMHHEWQQSAKMETVMYLTQPVSVLCQTEKKFTAVLGYPLKKEALTQLRSPHLSVIKLSDVDARTTLKREDILLENLSEVGLETKRRCELEAERHWCGNVTEDITGAPLVMSTREQLSTVLDLRTCRLVHVNDNALKRAIVHLSSQEYIISDKEARFFVKEKNRSDSSLSCSKNC